MQVIIISPNSTSHKHFNISPTVQLVSGLLIVSVVIVLAAMIYQWSNKTPVTIVEYVSIQSQSKVSSIPEQHVVQKSEMQAYYAKRIGELQAEAIRLKAITEELASMAGLDTASYVLDTSPAQGGIDIDGTSVTIDDFQSHIVELENIFSQQSTQLGKLQDYLITENNIESAIPSGKPIKEGWTSSYYGYRIDPFNGKKVFHHGLDFAGKAGSNIYAVADGMVSWTGKRGGYGEMIEVDHGNGYVTRYAHNKALNVQVGDRIAKGQVIASMGSTGRSTGPHVHFEILRDGKTVNPYNFVKR
ncbi:MAG: M23 family peptidase [Gammaproteobacteria bacterium]|nr:MAG: M23 family peptidase [Gammaproteobacteria bacterium]RKZ97021.1 MAG: M23 family peptidase [Gammaproteobacteria bacterium]RLA02187.1 MAG: M23 family peptidase [Gammaproteobacteria bacterium]